MFEQEIELEKKQGSAMPLLLMVGLIIVLVGVAAYYLTESRKVLAAADANTAVAAALAAQPAITVTFHTGALKPRAGETASHPLYRLLEKAGVITLSKGKATQVTLTSKGGDLLKQIPGVKSRNDDGNVEYVVPLATRKVSEISKIEMNGPERATVQYSWRWETNAVGDNFDASSPSVQSFNNWDRAALIDKYGVRFYHVPPTKAAMGLAKADKGWQVAND